MTGSYPQVPSQSSFFHINASSDPWLIQSNNKSWNLDSGSPPSLFAPDDEQQDWSPPETPSSSPPNIAAIKKSLIQAQQFLSTASHIDPWTVTQDSPPSSDKKSKVAKDGANIEEEITGQNLYKTELCRSFMETNTCRYGVKCQFAHGRHELRPLMRHPKYKTEICKTFHTLGTCPYGTRCRFIHTRPKEDGAPSSSSDSSPSFTPPDSPVLHSSPSSPSTKVLQWSTSWSSLDAQEVEVQDAPLSSPQDDVAQVPRSPPKLVKEDSGRRLPIFRNLC